MIEDLLLTCAYQATTNNQIDNIKVDEYVQTYLRNNISCVITRRAYLRYYLNIKKMYTNPEKIICG